MRPPPRPTLLAPPPPPSTTPVAVSAKGMAATRTEPLARPRPPPLERRLVPLGRPLGLLRPTSPPPRNEGEDRHAERGAETAARAQQGETRVIRNAERRSKRSKMKLGGLTDEDLNEVLRSGAESKAAIAKPGGCEGRPSNGGKSRSSPHQALGEYSRVRRRHLPPLS